MNRLRDVLAETRTVLTDGDGVGRVAGPSLEVSAATGVSAAACDAPHFETRRTSLGFRDGHDGDRHRAHGLFRDATEQDTVRAALPRRSHADDVDLVRLDVVENLLDGRSVFDVT